MKIQKYFQITLVFVFACLCGDFSFGQGDPCYDTPSAAYIGAYSQYEEDVAHRNMTYYPYEQDFSILQSWGCCIPDGYFNITVTVVEGVAPTKFWENTNCYNADAAFYFYEPGKYIIQSTHPCFSNCPEGYTVVDSLTFYLHDPTNDYSSITAYVSESPPIFGDDFPGHAWVKVIKSFCGNEASWYYNYQERGWWPIDESQFLGYKGTWHLVPHNPDRTANTTKTLYCDYSESGGAMIYMNGEEDDGQYELTGNNCVKTSRIVFDHAYDGTIPPQTSLWSGFSVETPSAWADWLNANIN